MTQMPAGSHGGEWLPVLDIPEPGRQRRLTVLFRWLLLIPQFIALFFLGIVAFFATVIGWFGALFTGRLPGFAFRYLSAYLGYSARVESYEMLLVDKYPPFSLRARDHPVRIEVHPGQLNRLAVFFRIVLAIPAGIIQGVLLAGWGALSFLCWLVVLILGRMPRPLFEAIAAVERYSLRYEAYMMMLTPAYPKRLFGDGRDRSWDRDRDRGEDVVPGEPRTSATRPLRISSAGMALLVLFIVVGALTYFGSGYWSSGSDSTTACVGYDCSAEN
jgi:hypothetical protein